MATAPALDDQNERFGSRRYHEPEEGKPLQQLEGTCWTRCGYLLKQPTTMLVLVFSAVGSVAALVNIVEALQHVNTAASTTTTSEEKVVSARMALHLYVAILGFPFSLMGAWTITGKTGEFSKSFFSIIFGTGVLMVPLIGISSSLCGMCSSLAMTSSLWFAVILPMRYFYRNSTLSKRIKCIIASMVVTVVSGC